MKTLYFLPILCGILLMSCSKHSDEAFINQKIIGTWKWVKTDGGIANNIHDTPASTGNNIDLKITDDNHYFFYTNGVLTSQGTYAIEIRNCIHDHTNKNVINFSSLEDQDMMIERVDDFTLESSDDVYDGTVSIYSKI